MWKLFETKERGGRLRPMGSFNERSQARSIPRKARPKDGNLLP